MHGSPLRNHWYSLRMSQKLITLHVAIFVLGIPFFYTFQQGQFVYPDELVLATDAQWYTRPWTLLSYALFHRGFLHLLFNILVLHWAGQWFEVFFNDKQLLVTYIGGALGGGVAVVGVALSKGVHWQLAGASAAIMAVLWTVTTYRPQLQIRLALVGNVPLWVISGSIALLDVLQLLVDNTGGRIAHLSGAVCGVLFALLLQRGYDPSQLFILSLPQRRSPLKTVHRSPSTGRPRSVVIKSKTQQQIDELLDKISRSGYDSLTESEKTFLFRAGQSEDESTH